MKKAFLLAFLLLSFLSFAQTYSISNWYNNKQSATVLTFDDWDPSSPEVSLPLMLSKEVPGTYFVTINNAWRDNDYATMSNAATQGIEIANHTVSHPSLISAGNYAAEIENCRTAINANVTQDLPVHTLAYPFGDYNATVIAEVKKHHVGARAVTYTTNNWGYNYPTTNDQYFSIPTIQVGTMGTLNDFIEELEDAIDGGGLYTIMYHSVGGIGWFDDIPEILFSNQLDELKAREDITWLTTFSNAVRYHKEKHCATLSTLSEDANTWTMELSDTLDNDVIFNHPLSITLTVPLGQTYLTLEQNGVEIPFTVISGTEIGFNAVPDGGDLVLTKGELITGILEKKSDGVELYPVPSSDYLNLRVANHLTVTAITISTMQGQKMYTIPASNKESINISSLLSGIYLLEITTANAEKIVKKFIKN